MAGRADLCDEIRKETEADRPIRSVLCLRHVPIHPGNDAADSAGDDAETMATDEPGRLIDRGRHADVFELGDTRVLRRYRTGQQAAPEAAVMEHVRSYGYPAPEVHRVDGSEMELERVEGPGMLDLVARQPHRIGQFARLLADLHRRLHKIPAPEGLASPFGRGDRVLHLDLQPANVVITARGPVVLDWGWAAAGPSEADGAHTWLQLTTSEVPGRHRSAWPRRWAVGSSSGSSSGNSTPIGCVAAWPRSPTTGWPCANSRRANARRYRCSSDG